MKVLLSNDDGIHSAGLAALYGALLARGHEVAIIAPMRQQSGVSHAITVFEPLRIQQFREKDIQGIGVFGTPADCVKLGLAELAPWLPDLVMAGMNIGKNVGPDVFYSGTIGAAAEGAHAGIASMAFSHANWQADAAAFAEACGHAVLLAESVKWAELQPGIVINVNYPVVPLAESRGVCICRQSPAAWLNGYRQNADPRGWPYWWMTGEIEKEKVTEDSDIAKLEAGYVTVTPLMFEHTATRCLEPLAEMGLDKPCFNV